MILKILLKIAVNAASIYIASQVLSDIAIDTGGNKLEFFGILALIGFSIWIANAIIKPLLKVLTFPLLLVTFGLFNIVLNMAILWGIDLLLPQITITGFITLLFATLIVSFINGLLFFI